MSNEPISRFGFRQDRGGPHLARTIMLKELKLLFSFIDTPYADKDMYLRSIVKKVRTKAKATPGAASFALLLGYLSGVRGESLYQTEYAKLLDCSMEEAIELSVEASRKGWIVLKRLGSVIEVLFPNLLSQQEMEWVREQS